MRLLEFWVSWLEVDQVLLQEETPWKHNIMNRWAWLFSVERCKLRQPWPSQQSCFCLTQEVVVSSVRQKCSLSEQFWPKPWPLNWSDTFRLTETRLKVWIHETVTVKFQKDTGSCFTGFVRSDSFLYIWFNFLLTFLPKIKFQIAKI